MGKTKIDVEGIVFLMSLFDGNPKYNSATVNLISEKLGANELSWDGFETLLDKIYGDQISDDPYQPQEIHIALGNDISSMKVMWMTMENLGNPFVQYLPVFEDNWKLAKSSAAVNYTYEVPQKWWPTFTGVIYDANMEGLLPDHRYKYRVGGWDSANATVRYSAEFPFKAAPESNNPNRPTKIATLADHGTFMLLGFATVNKMVELKERLGFEMVFVAGDLSYAGLSSAMPRLNISKEDEFEHMWDLLGIQNQPIAASYPWMVGNGNHERFYNWTAYTNRYHMPQNSALGSDGNFWYSFDYGNVHWVSISSEHSLDAGSPQMLFLTAALDAATANRAVVPWIVLTLHKPLYCSADGTPGGFAAKLEATVLKYDVDLVISGHMHGYERVHPVANGEVTVFPVKGRFLETGRADIYHALGKGPVHIMQGHAGGMQGERWIQPQPVWSAFRMSNGYVVPNRTRSEGKEEGGYMIHNGVRVDLSDSSAQTALELDGFPLQLPELSHFNYTDTYGFGVISTANSTHLHFKSHSDTDSNVAADEFWIVKDRSAGATV